MTLTQRGQVRVGPQSRQVTGLTLIAGLGREPEPLPGVITRDRVTQRSVQLEVLPGVLVLTGRLSEARAWSHQRSPPSNQ